MIPRLVIKGLLTASLMATMVSVSSTAAAAEKTFRVPFDFTVNGKLFPSDSYHVSAAEGGEYFLRQAWLGSGSGREIVPPRGERDRIKTTRSDKPALSEALVVVPAF